MSTIAYLVHNLSDAAVARRVRMFRAGEAEVRIAGFVRDAQSPAYVAGAAATNLGTTRDAALGQRIRQVAANLLRPQKLLETCAGADVIVARNLEMLVLGAYAQRRLRIGRLVYESLDIHRSLLGTGYAGKVMRAIERALIRRSGLLISSSPAFVHAYFQPMQDLKIAVFLAENKVLSVGNDAAPVAGQAPSGPPWRIGWFGNLRCKRTLDQLIRLAGDGHGRIEVIIAGKASPAEFDDFERQVDKPFVRYLGPYAAHELPGLYGQCHFAWAIDYFEEGLNSTWLLPNRLYEAACFGAVPIALRTVETGHWLASRNCGLLLSPPREREQLAARLDAMTTDEYNALRGQVLAIPREELIADLAECRKLVAAVAGT